MITMLLNAFRACGGFALVLLGGCSFSLVKPPPSPSYYEIPSSRNEIVAGPAVAWQLTIDEPQASREINTDRILVRSGNAEVKYFGGVRWIDRAPRLVQARLAEGFDRSGRIVGVAWGAPGIRSDYKLISELRSFSVLASGDRARANVSVALSLQLVRMSTATIIAAKTFEEGAATDAGSMEAVARSFGDALDKVVAQAMAWAIDAGETDSRARAKSVRAVK